MALTTQTKKDIIKKFSRGQGDTGSPEVQIGLLTQKVHGVTSHLSKHHKDDHTRRGLIKMVAKRRRLFDYLRTKSSARFDALQKELSL